MSVIKNINMNLHNRLINLNKFSTRMTLFKKFFWSRIIYKMKSVSKIYLQCDLLVQVIPKNLLLSIIHHLLSLHFLNHWFKQMINSVYPRNNYFCASTDDKIGSKKELPRWQMHNGLFAFLGDQVNSQGQDTESDHQHTPAR